MAYQRRNFQAGQKIKSYDLNVMDIQIEENEKKALEAQSIASGAEEKAAVALENSQNWTELILEARVDAQNAIQISGSAASDASNAKSAAENAQQTASNASLAAESAMAAAEGAKTTATNAEEIANEAKVLVENTNNANVFSEIYTSGVLAADGEDALKPTPGNRLEIVCAPGAMMINGVYKKAAKSTRKFLDNGEDRVEINLYRLYAETGEIVNLWRDVTEHGDMLLSPQDGAELPMRGGGLYDILICKVKFPTGTTQITTDMITDYRADPRYCGFVKTKYDPMHQQLRTLIGMLYTNGILEDGTNPLQSFPVGGMRLAMKPGTVVFDGTIYTQAGTKTIGFGISNTENIIALGYRYDRDEKTVYELRAENCIEQGSLLIHKNANGEQETLPSRNDAVYDVIHTILRIPANAAAIAQSMIQDVRNKQAYCGYAKFRMIGM